jgi:hypothetical protein
MNTHNVAQHLILTGSGFTANFGGLLTRDLWGRIFSRLSHEQILREVLLQQTNFEAAYGAVQSGDYPQPTKDLMANATLEAFAELDERVKGWTWTPGSPYPVNEYALRKLINRFSGASDRASGFFFTLNQDFFVERVYCQDPGTEPLTIPGLENPARLPLCSTHMRTRGLPEGDFLLVPTNLDIARLEQQRSGFYYVKLHGSYGWKGQAARYPLVIGQNKGDAISGSELLSWYFRVFAAAISAGNRRILIIGYGFGDAHVNQALGIAVRNNGLQLSVMTRSTDNLIQTLRSRPDCKDVLEGLRNIYDEPMTSLYPANQEFTEGNRRLQQEFFGSVVR